MIQLEEITKTYALGQQSLTVLKGVSLNIASGDYVAIMGPSGSGKSTLMNTIGLLDMPSTGTYTLEGKKVNELSEAEQAEVRSQRIGFVFQAFNLLPRMNAFRQVMQPLLYQGVSRKDAEVEAEKALTAVGLGERMHHLPNELSGGQKQRVAIARALVTHPALILADEPTGALDSITGKEIMDLLDQLNKNGVTIVIVTHEDSVAHHAKRTIHILDGLIHHES